MWAWGRNPGQLGIPTTTINGSPTRSMGPDNVGYLTDVVDVAAGYYHSLALKSDGTVYAWGENWYGQLGIHCDNDHTVPYQVHGPGNVGYLTGIIKVAAGANFSLALKEDGTLWAWGEGGYGQLGIHSDNDHTVPYQVHGPGNVGFLTDVVDVAAGLTTPWLSRATVRSGLGAQRRWPAGYPLQRRSHGPLPGSWAR